MTDKDVASARHHGSISPQPVSSPRHDSAAAGRPREQQDGWHEPAASARPPSEAALGASEESFRLLFANNPQPMWVYDLETLGFLEVNEATVAQYGYSRAEFLAMRLTDIRPAEDVTRLLEDVQQERPALQNSGEWRHRRKDGRIIDVAVSSHTLRFAGRAAALVCANDITEQKRAVAALRASEERLRTIVTNAPVVLFAVDRDGIFTLSDGQGLASLGLRPGQHVGHSYFDLYGHLPDSVSAMQRALSGEVATTINTYKNFVFETHWTPTFDARGSVSGVIGVSADISERARAEEERAALHERERAARAEAQERAAQLEATFGAMTDAVIVFDRSGRIVHANAALQHLMGLAQPLDERTAAFAPRDEHGATLPREHWPTYRILRGEVLTGPAAMDIVGRTVDGQEIQINIAGAPVCDHEGRVAGGILVMRDVTERRRLERRTREALEALLAMAQVLVSIEQDGAVAPETSERLAGAHQVGRRLAELTRDVLACRRVSISTFDARASLLRPLAVVGVSPEEERTWWSTATPMRLDLDPSGVLARLLAGEVVLMDMTKPPWRDQPNPYNARVILITMLRLGDDVVGVLALDHGQEEHDYTADELALAAAVAKLAALVIERDRLLRDREEARANEAALRATNRRMDEFLGIAGHEMRTPLTTISGQIQLAQRRIDRLTAREDASIDELAQGLASIRHLLDRTDAGLARLNGLVGDVLDVSRIQAGHLQMRLAPADLAAIVREVVDEQREMQPTRTIHLRPVTTEAIPVTVDAERIRQVLTNYLSNALKYSPPEREVTVGLGLAGSMARVWVRDAGPGLPPAEQPRIWERFYRAPGIDYQHGSSVGLGLGLHISRTIIERHGGAVGVESSPGTGATFWFTLPCARAD